MPTLTYTDVLQIVSCGVDGCGISHAIPDDLYRRAKRSSKVWWWCPNGHRIHYTDSENDELKRTLQQREEELSAARALARRERQYREQAERQRSAARGQVTKIKRRVANGVCPCCNRTFANLAKHMSGQHPDFVEMPS